MLGLFAASLHHEIKNPLYAIKSSLETEIDNLRRGQSAVDEASLSKMHLQAERMFKIMDSLNRLIKPVPKQEKRSADLKQCVAAVREIAAAQIFDKSIDLQTSIPEDLPRLHCPQHELETILLNLVINACDAVRKEGGDSAERGQGERSR